MKLKTFILVVTGIFDLAATLEGIQQKINENTESNLHCTNGRGIKITSANYGVTNGFPEIKIGNTVCRDNLSLAIVRDKCEGKGYCDIWVSDKTMGSNPCSKTKKYLQVEYECTGDLKQVHLKAESCHFPLGMENGTIGDSYITASSSLSSEFNPYYARLNSMSDKGGWCSNVLDTEQYLQVHFKSHHIVTKVAIQGRRTYDNRVENFSLSYSSDNKSFSKYKNELEEKVVFSGNSDRNTIVLHKLNPIIEALAIRIHPLSWHEHICLRAEFYGCLAKPRCYKNYCNTCKRSVPFPKAESGASLSGHVIDKFLVVDEDVCLLHCLRNRFCVSYNLGPTLKGVTRECEISNSDHVKHPDSMTSRDGYDYYTIENGCSSDPCQNNASCQADFESGTYECICLQGFTGKLCETDIDECSSTRNECDPDAICTNSVGSYKCTCPEHYIGDGKVCYVPETCTEILEYNGSTPSGPYYLKQRGGNPQLAYCHMEELTGCIGRGWTLVMKIDGANTTFGVSSPHWLNTTLVNPEAGAKSLYVMEETKLHTYWSTPLTKLCVGMSLPRKTSWLEIKHSSSSLQQIVGGSPKLTPTTKGKAAWKSLLQRSFQWRPYCNIEFEGFNVKDDNGDEMAKIGMLLNKTNCSSAEFYLGFGTLGFGCGSRDNRPFCYILIK